MNTPQVIARDLPTSRYGFHCRLEDLPFDQALSRVTEALKTEGFGVLTDIDVQVLPLM